MKIQQLLEYYTEMSIEEWQSPDVVERVKQDCSKFINEFLKNGTPIYRGLDDIHSNELHLIPTLSYREVHGMSFYNREVRESFENFLEDMGVSRYKHSVSTIGFDPDEYDGIDVGAWYLFLPKGGYSYHYYSGIAINGDINVDNTEFENLSSLGSYVEVIVSSFEMVEYKVANTTTDLSEIFVPHDLSLVKKMLNDLKKCVDFFEDIFNITANDIGFIESFVKKMDLFLRHTDYENDDINILDIIHDIISEMSKALERIYVIDDIKDSIVVNELPVEDSEIVFTCKEYYAIPYNDDGEQFIKELIK